MCEPIKPAPPVIRYLLPCIVRVAFRLKGTNASDHRKTPVEADDTRDSETVPVFFEATAVTVTYPVVNNNYPPIRILVGDESSR